MMSAGIFAAGSGRVKRTGRNGDTDPDRAIARAYHTLKDDGQGIQRTVYAIGKDGTVCFAQRGAPTVAAIVASVNAR